MKMVATLADVGEGRIHGVTVDEIDLALVRIEGQVHVFGGHCPHQHAPLEDGLLIGDRLVCPWHQAVFEATTGEVVEPPALDCLPSYEVEIRGEEIWVDVPSLARPARQPTIADRSRSGAERLVAIIGAGAAGLSAAQAMRHEGFDGRIVMLSAESGSPYDRTQLSKDYLAGDAPAEWLPLKPPEFFDDAGIELLEHRVATIDVASRRIAIPGGATITADGILLAMGSRPRSLAVPGAELDGVITLRTRADCERIAERAESVDHAVVVGAGFIGMESAASLKKRGVSKVTVVAPSRTPFEHALGTTVGDMFQKLHQDHGVEFRLGCGVERIGGDGSVDSVVLDSGDTLSTGLVVVGIGVEPSTDGVRGVELEDDGSLLVDELLRVCPGVYAAGDIATFPDWRTGKPSRIEHWRTAQQQGATAGRNLAGQVQPFHSVPFFWTMHFGVGLGYVGHAPSWDEEIVHGNPADHDFIVYYACDDRVLAGASVGRDLQINALHELMQRGQEPKTEELRDGALDLVARLRS